MDDSGILEKVIVVYLRRHRISDITAVGDEGMKR
jgi:hypothetical protein